MPNHGVCWFLMTLVAQQSRQLRSSGSGLCTVYDPADFLFTLCPAWERSEAHCCLAHLLSHLSKFVRRENHGQATECIYGGKAGGFDGHRGHWDGGYWARYGIAWEASLLWKIVCYLWLLVPGHTENFKDTFEGSNYEPGSIALAFYSGIYAFGGSNSLNYMTEELKNPNRCVPTRNIKICENLRKTWMFLIAGTYRGQFIFRWPLSQLFPSWSMLRIFQ